LEAAVPAKLFALEAVADELVSPEYVYLFLVERLFPRANIPIVLFPAAEPYVDPVEDAVAAELTSPEYVYLHLAQLLFPKANIPTELFPVAAPVYPAVEEDVADPLVQLE
jgi:hypothetical protein